MVPLHRYGSGRGAKPTLYFSRATVISRGFLGPKVIQEFVVPLVCFSPCTLWHVNVQHAF
jgi:hypothetical protein